jgi:hypothetical protein
MFRLNLVIGGTDSNASRQICLGARTQNCYLLNCDGPVMVERFAFHGLGGRQMVSACWRCVQVEAEGHLRTNMLWL